MNRPYRLLALAFSVVVGLAAFVAARAAEIDPPIDEWHHTVWAAKDGAPRDVWAISQTPDGWMWFGSPGGLYRFDGITFERVETEPVGSNRSRAVSALLALSTNALVVGYRSGGVTILRDGKVFDYNEGEGFDDVTVFDMAADADQHVWVATRSGLLRFDGRHWQRLGLAQGVPVGPVTAVRSDRNGRLWIAAGGRILHAERGSSLFMPGPTIDSPANFLQAPDGRLWYDTMTEILPCPLQGEAGVEKVTLPLAPSSESTFDAQGGLWFTVSTAVVRVAPIAPWPTGLPHDFRRTTPGSSRAAFPGVARTIFADRDGAVWVGTIDGEVHQFRKIPASQVSFPRGELVRGALEATSDGAVWAASRSSYYGSTDGDGLWRIDGDPARVQPSDLRSATVAFASHDGTLVVAGDGWLWRRRDGRFAHDIALPASARANPVVAIAEDGPSGSMWVSLLGAGLFLRRGDVWERNGGVSGLPQDGATAVASDAQGTLWLGYANGLVIALHGQDGARTPQVLDAQVGSVRVISTAPRVLVGGDRGLAILQNGGLRALRADEPAAFGVITGLVQTPAGEVWLNGQEGAVRIRSAELQRVLTANAPDVTANVYDAADGYSAHGASTLPYGNSMALGSDGRIWFCGAAVPAWLDPTQLRSDSAVSPLVLRSLTTASGRIDAHGPVHLGAGTRDVEVDYTTLDYTHPDHQRFRYRLVGLDEHWTYAQARRQALFTNLRPGNYRFEVESKSGPAEWTALPLTLDIQIPPTFTQSWTFVALCAAGALLTLVLTLRARDEQLRRHERAKLDERLAERERIARELHDTLLQSTQGLALAVQAATTRITPGDPSREMLEQALKEADTLMIEGRDRIQNLRAEAFMTDRLEAALGALGRKQAQEHSIAFKLFVDGASRPLQPAFADEAHRVGTEALLNAFQHAKANRIEVELIHARREFRLVIRDNGIGIDRDILQQGFAPGRWGLRGMRERAERVGARLAIWSANGAGTEIDMRARATRAYSTASIGAWDRFLERTPFRRRRPD